MLDLEEGRIVDIEDLKRRLRASEPLISPEKYMSPETPDLPSGEFLAHFENLLRSDKKAARESLQAYRESERDRLSVMEQSKEPLDTWYTDMCRLRLEGLNQLCDESGETSEEGALGMIALVALLSRQGNNPYRQEDYMFYSNIDPVMYSGNLADSRDEKVVPQQEYLLYKDPKNEEVVHMTFPEGVISYPALTELVMRRLGDVYANRPDKLDALLRTYSKRCASNNTTAAAMALGLAEVSYLSLGNEQNPRSVDVDLRSSLMNTVTEHVRENTGVTGSDIVAYLQKRYLNPFYIGSAEFQGFIARKVKEQAAKSGTLLNRTQMEGLLDSLRKYRYYAEGVATTLPIYSQQERNAMVMQYQQVIGRIRSELDRASTKHLEGKREFTVDTEEDRRGILESLQRFATSMSRVPQLSYRAAEKLKMFAKIKAAPPEFLQRFLREPTLRFMVSFRSDRRMYPWLEQQFDHDPGFDKKLNVTYGVALHRLLEQLGLPDEHRVLADQGLAMRFKPDRLRQIAEEIRGPEAVELIPVTAMLPSTTRVGSSDKLVAASLIPVRKKRDEIAAFYGRLMGSREVTIQLERYFDGERITDPNNFHRILYSLYQSEEQMRDHAQLVEPMAVPSEVIMRQDLRLPPAIRAQIYRLMCKGISQDDPDSRERLFMQADRIRAAWYEAPVNYKEDELVTGIPGAEPAPSRMDKVKFRLSRFIPGRSQETLSARQVTLPEADREIMYREHGRKIGRLLYAPDTYLPFHQFRADSVTIVDDANVLPMIKEFGLSFADITSVVETEQDLQMPFGPRDIAFIVDSPSRTMYDFDGLPVRSIVQLNGSAPYSNRFGAIQYKEGTVPDKAVVVARARKSAFLSGNNRIMSYGQRENLRYTPQFDFKEIGTAVKQFEGTPLHGILEGTLRQLRGCDTGAGDYQTRISDILKTAFLQLEHHVVSKRFFSLDCKVTQGKTRFPTLEHLAKNPEQGFYCHTSACLVSDLARMFNLVSIIESGANYVVRNGIIQSTAGHAVTMVPLPNGERLRIDLVPNIVQRKSPEADIRYFEFLYAGIPHSQETGSSRIGIPDLSQYRRLSAEETLLGDHIILQGLTNPDLDSEDSLVAYLNDSLAAMERLKPQDLATIRWLGGTETGRAVIQTPDPKERIRKILHAAKTEQVPAGLEEHIVSVARFLQLEEEDTQFAASGWEVVPVDYLNDMIQLTELHDIHDFMKAHGIPVLSDQRLATSSSDRQLAVQNALRSLYADALLVSESSPRRLSLIEELQKKMSGKEPLQFDTRILFDQSRIAA